jgi:prepilin-type N-terminal cleavage/methylation domain-containing protein/prepilin-type processing-associated H-X9-DG protein
MNRRAFTLVELLAVLGVVTVLVSLAIPAVQKVRAAADKLACASQLRQIGLAIHVYHNDYGIIPAGINSQRRGQHWLRMTWLARLLPYLEMTPLWQQTVTAYGQNPRPFANPPHVGFGTAVKHFACPADERVHRPQGTHRNYTVGLTSYVGVLGTNYLRRDGSLILDGQLRLTDLRDGTSHTLLAGERPPSPDHWYGWWYAGFGQLGTGSLDMLLGVREENARQGIAGNCPPGPYHFRPGRIDALCAVFQFWSLHPSGGNFLFGDGGVRFLTYDADRILPALATRAGGEAVSDVD